MYEMSSNLPSGMIQVASNLLERDLSDQVRGIVYNGDIAGIIQALEIGTRPANLP
jgi:hypothetical protein